MLSDCGADDADAVHVFSLSNHAAVDNHFVLSHPSAFSIPRRTLIGASTVLFRAACCVFNNSFITSANGSWGGNKLCNRSYVVSLY